MTAFGRYDYIAVKDEVRCGQVPCGFNEQTEAFSPIVPPPGVNPYIVFALVQLDAITVELDFVNPLFTARHLVAQGCKTGVYEARHARTLRALKPAGNDRGIVLGDVLALGFWTEPGHTD